MTAHSTSSQKAHRSNRMKSCRRKASSSERNKTGKTSISTENWNFCCRLPNSRNSTRTLFRSWSTESIRAPRTSLSPKSRTDLMGLWETMALNQLAKIVHKLTRARTCLRTLQPIPSVVIAMVLLLEEGIKNAMPWFSSMLEKGLYTITWPVRTSAANPATTCSRNFYQLL